MQIPETATTLPEWLRRPPSAAPPSTGGRRSNRWADRTVRELANAAREMAITERWARGDGLLQRRDPRAKWVAVLALLVGTGLLHHPLLLAAIVALGIAAAAATGVPPLLLMRRVAASALFFGAFVSLPALLLTDAGAAGATRALLRIAASLSVTLLLLHTTRWRDLVAGLRGLAVPSLFVQVLERTYLHLYQLPVTAANMFQARRARTVGPAPATEARRYVGFSIGALLGKAHSLAEATHDAQRARGYTVGSPAAPLSRWSGADVLLAGGALLLTLAMVLGERYLVR